VPAIRFGVLLGERYEIAEELGRGAFGVVYRALDTRLKRKSVAVKILLETALATPDAVRRFRAEAQLLCQVQHAQVPAVLDLGEYSGQQYIVFAFVNGKTVRELIPPGGFADPAAAVRLTAKLARTLHDIYTGQEILHRDVKPANMMVPAGQADGLYLMDFGLAVCHDTDETRTQEGTMMGTLWYMSPEQAEGRISAIGHPSDLYSAAAVLYHLLTGRPPFDSKWPAIVADILMTEPSPPSYYRPGLDPELDAIVLKGLSKRPADRYPTGAEFAERLELWAARALLSGTAVGSTVGGVSRGPAPGSPSVRTVPFDPTGGRVAAPPARPPGRPSAGEGSSVVTGSTLPADPRLSPRGPAPAPAAPNPQVVVVTAFPPPPAPAPRRPPAPPPRDYKPLILKVAAVVVALGLLGAGGYALVQMAGTKPAKTPAPTNPAPPAPAPQGERPKWQYGKE
jgi:tRNA A-37 threonylcarbamoyl transferase component Bud32